MRWVSERLECLIREELGEEVELINTGKILCREMDTILADSKVEKNASDHNGQSRIYITDWSESFRRVADFIFQNQDEKELQVVDI